MKERRKEGAKLRRREIKANTSRHITSPCPPTPRQTDRHKTQYPNRQTKDTKVGRLRE